MDDLAAFLDASLATISGRSELAKAIRYARSRWTALTRYLGDGALEISNNAAKRAIHDGDYAAQPRSARVASVFYGIATAGGTLAYQKMAPTREAADKLLNDRLAASFAADANGILYAWESSRDYNAAPELERIQAALLVINSADDERNPPETGIVERELKRVKNARLFLIP
jgi:pimeloyl-ACP methyl ester carboxylesterase